MVRYWGAFARFGAPLVRGQTLLAAVPEREA